MTSKSIIEQKRALKHEDIAMIARQLWEQNGFQSGRDAEYWLEAEQLLLLTSQPEIDQAKTTPTTPTKSGGAAATGKKAIPAARGARQPRQARA